MDDTIKLTSINVVLGLIAGVLSGIFSIGYLGFTNDMIGLLIGVIFIYATLKVADNIVEGEIDRSQKIWDCVLPFFFVWIIVWILLANYL
ncbi:hypothetical protein [Methanobrevibacter sp.]|uniref:EMC6-like membrane protein n=1 Tax=Methanobrevibacter sp. TaxID=66852 RepID=UPI0038907215